MNLSTQDAQLFFKLFLAILAYVNRQLNVVPNVSKPSDLYRLGTERTAKIRDALYAHRDLLDRFISENPEGFAPEELNFITSWKHRVSGEFYLMRYLKKYAVFMPAKKADRLFGVLGLFDPIEVVVRGQPLPVLLKTTLLPFKGQIIYEGIVAPYTILFGRGITSDLKRTYNRLKEKEGIIEQLVNPEGDPDVRTSVKARAAKPAPDWKPVIAEIVARADAMKRADTPEQTAALGLLRAAARLALAVHAQPDGIQGSLKQVRRALNKVEMTLYEVGF